jgi:hypothetical protein
LAATIAHPLYRAADDNRVHGYVPGRCDAAVTPDSQIAPEFPTIRLCDAAVSV